jgi:hypothetical protein
MSYREPSIGRRTRFRRCLAKASCAICVFGDVVIVVSEFLLADADDFDVVMSTKTRSCASTLLCWSSDLQQWAKALTEVLENARKVHTGRYELQVEH